MAVDSERTKTTEDCISYMLYNTVTDCFTYIILLNAIRRKGRREQ